MGAGASRLEMNLKDGFFVGADTFATAPFSVDFLGALIANNITITGGKIKYGKTSFTDSTNAGYYIGAEGVYIGSASDEKYLKYTVATGAISIRGSLNADDIVAGTLIGRTVKAAGGAGIDIWMDSSDGKLKYLYGGVEKASMWADSSGALNMYANNFIYLSNASGKDIFITSGGLLGIYANGATQIGYNNDGGAEILLFRNNEHTNFIMNDNDDAWFDKNVSASSFTDRTPHYDGDAISDIKMIKGKIVNGKKEIDHESLPNFMRKTIKNEKGELVTERDLGNTISILLKAITELDERLDKLEKKT